MRKDAHPYRRHVIHGIRRVEGHYRIEIAAIHSFGVPVLQLYQVGGRGLLGHRAGRYPVCPSPPLCEAERASALDPSSHERWDGAGYPDGLAGDEIPLGSRIICACDAYDAIVSARPYSVARSREEALAELSRCAGSQFDAEVVQALTAVITMEDAGAHASEAGANGASSGLLSPAGRS